ncbi:MAG: cbb3-type cytochrome oxidase assembly protein CcoS [Chitinophagaceae bacterium]|nr:cbb3-type cytochrome oxidase assembly protein CcoS [Bacteroidota bacterium]MCC6256974.1 cbb3-type cytochrome oxidase assembly protein CcoS [Chitinophagaceae bacterium]MCW5916335.1 cbb3-type cytochrome oxidase assembly protein CcoS [Ferruginibacter sp.]
MSVIIVLIISSISVAGIFLLAFLWSVKSGQFEDPVSPASRILFEDHPPASSNAKPQKSNNTDL